MGWTSVEYNKAKHLTLTGEQALEFIHKEFWDLIIMNPPFDKGAEHLLHAIELARNTNIVCLLNAETIENPCTKNRLLLKTYIEEQNGSIEFLEQEFSSAERKTNVRTALVRLRMEDPQETFDYNFDKEKLPGPEKQQWEETKRKRRETKKEQEQVKDEPLLISEDLKYKETLFD